ncbi:MAG: FHA domain-containing protein [Isosphaeraceae bacterium]
MPARLVALDEGPDIPLDRAMIVVGRHPQCDARLDSLRVSRHHCCMTQDQGEVVVRDLGSTNGIRINGQRVECGRLRVGDELSIAHIRYRLENGQAHDATLADPGASRGKGTTDSDVRGRELIDPNPAPPRPGRPPAGPPADDALAAVFRGFLPAGLADRCKIRSSSRSTRTATGTGPTPRTGRDSGPARPPRPARQRVVGRCQGGVT